MSSGHSYGAIEAGASQYFGSKPHTEPDIRPPGPDSPGDHFFHVDIDFWKMEFNQKQTMNFSETKQRKFNQNI